MVCETTSDDVRDQIARVRRRFKRSAGVMSGKVLLPARGLTRFQDNGHWCFCVDRASSIARP